MEFGRKRKLLTCVLSFLGIVAAAFWLPQSEESADTEKDEAPVLFSESEAFSAEGLEIMLYAEDTEKEIYYTLDGSVPDKGAMKYEAPIKLESAGKSGGGIQVTTIRAAYGDGTGLSTRTYFVGEEVHQHFDTMVVCITSDPVNLYDPKYGILAGENYWEKGKEWEREAYVEFFDETGQRLVEENVGIRITGGASRQNGQKSFRLYAREKYGSPALAYEFFPGLTYGGSRVTSFEKIGIRSNGNDAIMGGFMRDECVQELARQAGFPDTQAARPIAVYLNGSYYGFAWLKNVYDEQYFRESYGTGEKDGVWQTVSPVNGEIAMEDTGDPLEARAVRDARELYAYGEADLTEDAVFAEFCQLVDIENLLFYYAIQVYTANADWPANNVKLYRYYSYSDSYEAGHADGRWRFLLYDADFALGSVEDSKYYAPTMKQLLGISSSLSPEINGDWGRKDALFTALMKREDMQTAFGEQIEELISGAFSTENMLKVIDEIETLREKELDKHLKQAHGEEGEALEQQYERTRRSVEKMREFAEERPAYIRQELQEVFGFS